MAPVTKVKGKRLISAGPYVGGNWSNGANAGLWYVNCNNDASNANSNIGARLASE